MLEPLLHEVAKANVVISTGDYSITLLSIGGTLAIASDPSSAEIYGFPPTWSVSLWLLFGREDVA
jgi:hypothetical protein